MIKKPNVQSRCFRNRRVRILGFALVIFLAVRPVNAASDEDVMLPAETPRRIGRNQSTTAGNAEGVYLPYRQIVRDTEPLDENLFRDVRAGGSFTEKLGPADASVQGSVFGPRLNLPLISRGIRPEEAEFKLGRFYLDLQALSTSFLYSDNVDLSETDRDSGFISIVRLTAAALFQVTDTVRLSVQGTLVWLPFKNKAGVAGFGIDDPWTEFDTLPLFQSQLTLDHQIGGWDVEAIDEVRVRQRRFGYALDAFDGEQFDEQDRAGRYSYRSTSQSQDRNSRSGYYIEGRNLVGASAGRLLPTETRLEFGGYHANYWYNDTDETDLPNSRDTVYAMLVSQRETMRFKPFIRYRAWHYDNSAGWSEEVRAGVQGPVTENLSLLADGGYYWRTDTDHTTYLARLGLRHTLNPITYHQLEYHRGVTEPDEEIADTVTYRLQHVFRDDLTGQFYASMSKYEDAETGGRTGTARDAALRFTYELAQSITLPLSGAYSDVSNDDPEDDDYHEWIARSELLYRHTATVQTRLIYQYRDRESDTPGQSYWENLVVLTVFKYF